MIQDKIAISCPVCLEELSSSQMVYTQCCFQKICATCDQLFKSCVTCRADLGDVRIGIGSQPSHKNFSQLRLLPGKNTVGSVILTVKKFFPVVETQLAQPLGMNKLDSKGNWEYLIESENEITNIGQYYLQNMRLPHKPLSDFEVEGWIVTLLISGKKLTKNKLTKEEFHRKCNAYAMRLQPFNISQDYINSRLNSLEARGYCKLDEKEEFYHYAD